MQDMNWQHRVLGLAGMEFLFILAAWRLDLQLKQRW